MRHTAWPEPTASRHTSGAVLTPPPRSRLHVPDGERSGKPFESFFKVTPADLLSAGIYRPLAMPWYHRSSYRAISISTVALHALHAKKQRAWWGFRAEPKQEEAQETSGPKGPSKRGRVRFRGRRRPMQMQNRGVV